MISKLLKTCFVLVYDKQYIIWRITVLEPESRLREWKEKVNN